MIYAVITLGIIALGQVGVILYLASQLAKLKWYQAGRYPEAETPSEVIRIPVFKLKGKGESDKGVSANIEEGVKI